MPRALQRLCRMRPEANPETKRDVVWFALNEDRPLCACAGIGTEFKGDRGTKSKPVPGLTSSTLSDDGLERGCRAYSPKGHARDPGDR